MPVGTYSQMCVHKHLYVQVTLSIYVHIMWLFYGWDRPDKKYRICFFVTLAFIVGVVLASYSALVSFVKLYAWLAFFQGYFQGFVHDIFSVDIFYGLLWLSFFVLDDY